MFTRQNSKNKAAGLILLLAAALTAEAQAEIILTFSDNVAPSPAPLPFANVLDGLSSFAPVLDFRAADGSTGYEFRVMFPDGTGTNDGLKNVIDGGETWTFADDGTFIAVGGTPVNPGATETQTSEAFLAGPPITQFEAGFPICSETGSPDCPTLQQTAPFLGVDFNFLAPIQGSVAGTTYGVGVLTIDGTNGTVSVFMPVAQAQYADGSYIIGADPDGVNNFLPDNPITGEPGLADTTPYDPATFVGVTLTGAITNVSSGDPVTFDFVLFGERRMTRDEVTVGGFTNNIVQWELPGSGVAPASAVIATEASAAAGATTAVVVVVPGTIAVAAGSTDDRLTLAELQAAGVPADDQVGAPSQGGCFGSCFDYVISGLAVGEIVNVVLPLTDPVPATPTVRKFANGIWEDFDVSGSDVFSSAPGALVGSLRTCPAPGDVAYVPGALTEGDFCVQLTITEGAENDADGVANGTLVDPVGVGSGNPIPPTLVNEEVKVSGGGFGCVLAKSGEQKGIDVLLLAGFIAGMSLIRRRRRAR